MSLMRLRLARRRVPAGLASRATDAATAPAEPLNGYTVLDQVVAMPISTWRYRWDPPNIRHLGPMAQDWWKAFQLGDGDTTINCTDANGVALVCIQALHRRIEELQKEISALHAQLAATPPSNPSPDP
jgi:hypothetical protein